MSSHELISWESGLYAQLWQTDIFGDDDFLRRRVRPWRRHCWPEGLLDGYLQRFERRFSGGWRRSGAQRYFYRADPWWLSFSSTRPFWSVAYNRDLNPVFRRFYTGYEHEEQPQRKLHRCNQEERTLGAQQKKNKDMEVTTKNIVKICFVLNSNSKAKRLVPRSERLSHEWWNTILPGAFPRLEVSARYRQRSVTIQEQRDIVGNPTYTPVVWLPITGA